MISANEALKNCADELFQSKLRQKFESRLFEESMTADSSHSTYRFRDESSHLSPHALFPDPKDFSLFHPVALEWIGVSEDRSADLLRMGKKYFSCTKPGHFHKKVLNAHLQR